MERLEANRPADAEPTGRHDLVVIPGGAPEDGHRPRPIPNRPLAGFLAQLIVSAEPALRPSRSERTRSAAARYAEVARRA